MVSAKGWIDVRWYDEQHLAALRSVHGICFPGENWTRRDFVRFHDRPGQVVKVILNTDTNEVIGSLLYRMNPAEVRIARIAVVPEYRRQGVATWAIRQALTGPDSLNRRQVYTARVREYDLPAQKLLKGLEFKVIRSQPGVFDHPTEAWAVDAYWFQFTKTQPARRRRILPETEITIP